LGAYREGERKRDRVRERLEPSQASKVTRDKDDKKLLFYI